MKLYNPAGLKFRTLSQLKSLAEKHGIFIDESLPDDELKRTLREELANIETENPLDSVDANDETTEPIGDSVDVNPLDLMTDETPDEIKNQPAPTANDFKAAFEARRAQQLKSEEAKAQEEFAKAGDDPIAIAIAERRAQSAKAHVTTSVEDAIANRRRGGNTSFAEALAQRRREAQARRM